MTNSVLERLCREKGATLLVRPNGHVQIRGKLLVNYYPNAKSRCAYVAGTTGGKKNCSPADAVEMAFEAPDRVIDPANRKKNSRAKRYAMLKRSNKCHWCKSPLNLDNSTIEHLIPLARGGLDNANNRVLACKPCNEKRGHNMPELNQ